MAGRAAEGDRPLPLESGITLLVDAERSTRPHRLVLAQRSAADGHVLWVDARDRASSYVLYGLAGEERRLHGIELARAWTAYQHHTLVRSLVERTTSRTGLLVLPDVCALYRNDDVDGDVGERLLASTLETVAELARVADVPVLLTAPPAERGTLDPYVDVTLRDEAVPASTSPGLGTDPHRRWLQTTIPDWVRRVGVRGEPAPLAEHRPRVRQTALGPRQRL